MPKKRKPLRLRFDAIDKASKDMVDLKKATKRFDGLDRAILDAQDLEIRKGDRIGIVGGNGQGKTTLLKLIVGDEKLTSGSIEVSPGVVIGYFHQDHATLDFDLNPVEQMRRCDPTCSTVTSWRAGPLPVHQRQGQNAAQGTFRGERARVALLKLLLEDNNLLLMDEPTNHLDMSPRTRWKKPSRPTKARW